MGNRAAAALPQVYHSECLGFAVDEDIHWDCPRHFCGGPRGTAGSARAVRDARVSRRRAVKCGGWAKYVCRWCPTAYCQRVRAVGAARLDGWLAGGLRALCDARVARSMLAASLPA